MMPKGVYARKVTPPAERLLALSIPVTDCGCWIFLGCLNHAGYGWFTTQTGVTILAHRASFSEFVCDIPEGMSVLHSCDTPSCINPDHLSLGTQVENMADMSRRGRAQSGDRHFLARLTAEKVRAIRASKTGCTTIAREYGVSPMTILDARHRRTWKHVT
jgi:hypothetical protein